MVQHSTRIAVVGVVFSLVLVTPAAWAQWSDDFDSYNAGTEVIGQGDWAGWDQAPVGADVTDEEASSAPNSLRLRTDTDLVAVYTGFTGGIWTVRGMVHIPSDHTGQTWFILLNTYSHGGPKNWSTQVVFENGQVASGGGTGFGGGGSLPAILDEWVELKIEIDFDLNLQVITYDGEFLDETPWQASGIDEIQAIDLFSANGSVAYIDDLVIEPLNVGIRPERTTSVTGDCPDPDPVTVTVTQPVPDGADAAELVTVTENALGNLGAAQVTALNGGTATDILHSGLTNQGFITAWLLLGPFTGHAGGNNPGCDEMMRDFLTDGDDFQEDIEPQEGDTINTDFGNTAASTGVEGPGELNPGGLPTWNAHFNDDDTIDFNTEYYGGNIDNVIVHAFAYVRAEADVDVDLCIGSDDSVEVIIDGVSTWCNSVPRGFGAANLCQDTVPFGVLEEGLHTVLVKVFEGGGGHGFRFGFKAAGTADPAPGISVCLEPEAGPCPLRPIGAEITWEVPRSQVADGIGYSIDFDQGEVNFAGDVDGIRTLGERSLSICRCLDVPVSDLTCEFGAVGLGEGLVLNWTNPPGWGENCDQQTIVSIDGSEIGTAPPTAETFGIPDGLLPDGVFVVTVTNGGGATASCSPFSTDANGRILGGAWSVIGPFANPFGCDPDPNVLLGNHLAPSFIGCLYPQIGDEIAYDADDPDNVSTGITSRADGSNVSESGLPVVERFEDGSNGNGDLDFEGQYGVTDDHVAWVFTYIENQSGGPLNVTLCFNSDDQGQVWFNEKLVHNTGACRGRGDAVTCQDTVPVVLPEGHVRIAAAAWERGGGWGLLLGLQDEFGVPIIDDGNSDIVFHGSTRPVAEDQYPCVEPSDPVTELACEPDGEGGVNLSWTNPPENTSAISINVDGVDVAQLSADAESYSVSAGDLGDVVTAQICIDNGAFDPTCCAILLEEELYINCGGDELIDLDGRVWTADSVANPSPFLTSRNANAANTALPLGTDDTVMNEGYPPEIFAVERWNDGPVEYSVSGLSPGTYDVTLLFMEHCCADGCVDGDAGALADPCEAVSFDDQPPTVDPATVSSSCRVFDILINGNIVRDQFSRGVVAACVSGSDAGPAAYQFGFSVVLEGVPAVGGTIAIRLDDLGAGNPPENAAIQGIALVPSAGGEPLFRRGDADAVGEINLTDGVFLLNFLFLGGSAPPCLDAADANDDGQLNITTGVYVFNWLFLGGPLPLAPGPTNCGPDATPDELGCANYDNC